MKPFNWVTTWALLLAVFTIFLSIPQSNPIEETIGLVDFVSSDGFDAPEASVENTGSDIWSDAILYSHTPVVYLYEVTMSKWPQLDRLNYWLFAANGYDAYISYWCKPARANKNNFIV